MCGDPYGWMCDECFANVRENPDAALCDECKRVAEKMCFCCMTESEQPLNEDGLCQLCAEQDSNGTLEEYMKGREP